MDYISQFISYLEERNLSPNTIKVYRCHLEEFRNFLGRSKSKFSIGVAKRKEIKTFLFALSEKKNEPITKRAKLTTLRSFYKYLEDEGAVKNNPAKNLPLPRVAIKEPEFLSETEIRKILKATSKDKNDRAEIAVRILSETGFRLSELASLSAGDVDTKQKTIRVARKGGMEQIVPINLGLNKFLKKVLKGKDTNDPVIANRAGGRMTSRRVAIMIKDYFRKAKVDRPGISVHSFRHSFCVRLMEKKVNLKTIQVLCNHSSISTTERYLHISNPELRKGVQIAEIK